jgi:hypothetical protein
MYEKSGDMLCITVFLNRSSADHVRPAVLASVVSLAYVAIYYRYILILGYNFKFCVVHRGRIKIRY